MDAAGGSPVQGWRQALPKTKGHVNSRAAALPGARTALPGVVISFLVVPLPFRTPDGQRAVQCSERMGAGLGEVSPHSLFLVALPCWSKWWPRHACCPMNAGGPVIQRGG